MTTPEVAVLSYHGWEIDPDRLAGDVVALRERGWRELSLAELEAALTTGQPRSARSFHVTIDDGAEGDLQCVAALRRLSCPATLFVSLDVMTDAARQIHRELAASPDIAVEDHSLAHNRIFHYRHIVGFHSEAAPLVTSPERLGLRDGDPVCTYGGELARPAFAVDARARELCRAAARTTRAPAGTDEWRAEMTASLVASGLGFFRLGRLCVTGTYETRAAFRARVSSYLEKGHSRVSAFLGKPPIAFAHPWWEPSATADESLRVLGYRLAFAGRGLCQQRATFNIPRIFVSNATPRPFDPYADATPTATAAARWALESGRRAIFR